MASRRSAASDEAGFIFLCVDPVKRTAGRHPSLSHRRPQLWRTTLLHVLRKVLRIALQQRRHVTRDDVNFSANLLRFPRREPAEAEVAVQAARDALEKFLIRLPRGCPDQF